MTKKGKGRKGRKARAGKRGRKGVRSGFAAGAGTWVDSWPVMHGMVKGIIEKNQKDMPPGWSGDPSEQFSFTWMHIMMHATGAPIKTLEGLMWALELEGYSPTEGMSVAQALFDDPNLSDDKYMDRIKKLLKGSLSESTCVALEQKELIHKDWRQWDDDYQQKFPVPPQETEFHNREADDHYRDKRPQDWDKLFRAGLTENQRLDWFYHYDQAYEMAGSNKAGNLNSFLCALQGEKFGTQLTRSQQVEAAHLLRDKLLENDVGQNAFLSSDKAVASGIKKSDIQKNLLDASDDTLIEIIDGYWRGTEDEKFWRLCALTAANRKCLLAAGTGQPPGSNRLATGAGDLPGSIEYFPGLREDIGANPEDFEDTSDEPTEIGLPPPNTANRTLAGSITAAEYESMMEAQAAEGDFAGPKSAKEYSAIMDARKRLNLPSVGSVFSKKGGAPYLVQRRWDEVRTDRMDAAEVYFDFLTSLHEKNCNIMGNIRDSGGPGCEGDYSQMFNDGSAKMGFKAFRDTLSKAMIFAFPGWWWDACGQMWDIKNMSDWTKDFRPPLPFPRTKFNNPVEMDKLARHAKMWEETATEDEKGKLTFRRWEHHADVPFPGAIMPARQTFIGLEHEEDSAQSGGHLIYQRGQSAAVRGHACPTTVYHPAEDRMVKVDAIYTRGFLLDHTGAFWPENGFLVDAADGINGKSKLPATKMRGTSTIWGLFHAYLINENDCPTSMPFVRISFVSPLYIGAFGWTSADVDESHPIAGAKGTMHWAAGGRCLYSDALYSMVTAIDDHRVVQHNFSRGHKKQKRKSKQSGAPDTNQKRFQRVHMSSGPVISSRRSDVEGLGLNLPGRKLGYRVRVKSHERVFVRRGPKPLPEADRVLLISRGYTVYFSVDDMTYLDKRRLKIRAKKFPDGMHYIAMKTVRIPEHKRGPEDAEVVPQVHVVNPRVVADAMEWELSDDRQDDREKGK